MADLLQSVVDGVDVIAIGNDLDVYTSPSLREATKDPALIGRGRLVIDLTGTAFVDSYGLTAIIGVLRRIRAVDGSMAVACNRDSLLQSVRVMGLNKVLDIHETLVEAVASVREASGRESARPGEKKEDR